MVDHALCDVFNAQPRASVHRCSCETKARRNLAAASPPLLCATPSRLRTASNYWLNAANVGSRASFPSESARSANRAGEGEVPALEGRQQGSRLAHTARQRPLCPFSPRPKPLSVRTLRHLSDLQEAHVLASIPETIEAFRSAASRPRGSVRLRLAEIPTDWRLPTRTRRSGLMGAARS